MVRIEKIKINNARRLGKSVDIDFGEGATIILAPNGTGKTTIFECIELAITSEINRIKKSPSAIVKDGYNEMNVELCFTDDQSYKIAYNKNIGVKQLGDDLKRILDIGSDVSIPHMFRMTHLFEQHSKNWLVECDENEAGALLGKLPVSRDLQIILSKRTSLLRAVNVMESRAKEESEIAENTLKKFEELILKKEQLSTDTPEHSLDEIIIELNSISKVLSTGGYDKEQDAKNVSLYLEALKSDLTQIVDKKKAQIDDLIVLKERMNFFNQNSLELSNKEKIVNELSENENKFKVDEVQCRRKITLMNLIRAF